MEDVTFFDVCKEMCDRNSSGIQLAPLENIRTLTKVKAGTNVTIGVAGDQVGAIFHGKYVGGLLLCDREQYERVKKELEEQS